MNHPQLPPRGLFPTTIHKTGREKRERETLFFHPTLRREPKVQVYNSSRAIPTAAAAAAARKKGALVEWRVKSSRWVPRLQTCYSYFLDYTFRFVCSLLLVNCLGSDTLLSSALCTSRLISSSLLHSISRAFTLCFPDYSDQSVALSKGSARWLSIRLRE